VSKATFDYLGQFTWNRVLRWLRRKHPKASWGGYVAATCPGGGRRTARPSCCAADR
jgi:hypothetical protein